MQEIFRRREFREMHKVIALTQLKEPALTARVKESMCEVIPVIFWDGKWLILDALKEILPHTWKRREREY